MDLLGSAIDPGVSDNRDHEHQDSRTDQAKPPSHSIYHPPGPGKRPSLALRPSATIAVPAMSDEDAPPTAIELEDLIRRIDRPIVLVGMMGVGKTSVGKRLAGMLHCPFVDADHAIEKSAQMTIPEIFETFGEPYFRDGERRVIARLIHEHGGRSVIATGGGAFCNPDTRALLLDKAIAVWLDSEVETLLERTGRKDNRPLLKDGDPRVILTRLRDERRPFYSQAPIHVMSTPGPHDRAIFNVLKGIRAWL